MDYVKPVSSVRMTFDTTSFAVLDAETSEIRDGEIPQTKFWGLYDGQDYRRFGTTAKLTKYLKQRRTQLCMLHHFNFDILQLLVDDAPVEIHSSHNSKIIKSSIFKHDLLNSYAVFPLKLQIILEAFGYEKKPLSDLEARNQSDCIEGYDALMRLNTLFETLTGVSPFDKKTIAAAGLASAERVAGKFPNDLDLITCYRGGRVDVFDLRRVRASCYDISSSYPFSFIDAPKQDTLLEVIVDSKHHFGPLFDADNNERLTFPCGKFRSFVFESNWQRYIEPTVNGDCSIRIIGKRVVNLEWICALKDFIRHVYHTKQTGNEGIALACKLLLNSLYGRLGLRGESEKVTVRDSPPFDDSNCEWFRVGSRVLVFEKIARQTRANYPLAAFITDNARARLFVAAVANNALYCDTDSVFTENKEFIGDEGPKLGQWKFAGRHWFKARNLKDYDFGSKTVLKGGKRSLQWTIKRLARGMSVAEVIRETRLDTPLKRLYAADGSSSPLKIDVDECDEV